MQIRRPADDELDALAQLWLDGWREARLSLVPEGLARLRTFESFRHRLSAALREVRVAGAHGAPLGFYILKSDELYQLYVAAEARGSGVAAALIDDAESALAGRGVRLAWLSCAVGNLRAARFYEKRGWRNAGVFTYPETSAGTYPIEVWRYEKSL